MRLPVALLATTLLVPTAASAQSAFSLPSGQALGVGALNAIGAAKADATNGVLNSPQIMQNALNAISGLSSSNMTPCAGNAGQNAASQTAGLFAWGVSCRFVQPPLVQAPGTAVSQYQQTYAMQIGLEVPALASNPNISPAPGFQTDQVALYPEVRLGAWSPGGWAENPLVYLGPNSGGGIVSEMDMNNFRGCDVGGIDTDASSTGGSNTFTPNRSDGSACPTANGLLVTGVGGRISGQAISVSGVSGTAGDMWQDGLAMIGGYLINEADIYTNTGSRSGWRLLGVHTTGLNLQDGNFAAAAISLPLSSSGKLVWACPTGAPSASQQSRCVAGYPSTPRFIYPSNDGQMHFDGNGGWQFDGPVVLAQSATVKGNINVGLESHFTSANNFVDPTPGVAQALKASGGAAIDTVTVTKLLQLPSVTSTQLGACSAGQVVYASNVRNPGEAAGAGTGAPVFCNKNGAWLVMTTGAAPTT